MTNATTDNANQILAWLDTGEWHLQKSLPSTYMTDEANVERAWVVERQLPPYEDKGGARMWFGKTAYEAMSTARAAIAIDTGDSPNDDGSTTFHINLPGYGTSS